MANPQTTQDDAANLQALVGGAQAAPQPTGASAPQDDAANLHSLLDADAEASKTLEETGITQNSDGSWVIVPKEGESFADTMKRAAAKGKTVTPQMIQSQTKKGLKDAPIALAAGPAIGVGMLTAEAGLAEAPTVGKAILDHLESKAAQYASQYPHLLGIAKAMGIPTTTAGLLYYLHHLSVRDK